LTQKDKKGRKKIAKKELKKGQKDRKKNRKKETDKTYLIAQRVEETCAQDDDECLLTEKNSPQVANGGLWQFLLTFLRGHSCTLSDLEMLEEEKWLNCDVEHRIKMNKEIFLII
jgi:hypothetical protein